MWHEKMFAEIENAKDEARSVQMAAYMKDKFSFLGIAKPHLVAMIKPYLKTASKSEGVDWDFIFLCWQKNYREAQYAGIEYLHLVQKKLTDKDLDHLKHLIVAKSWWDTADSLDEVIGALSLLHPNISELMLQWSQSDNIWLRRVAIDHQQKYKEKTDTALLEKIILNNLGTSEFFINKAIGWSLREYSKVNPQWVAGFLEKHKEELAKLSIKEASKYL